MASSLKKRARVSSEISALDTLQKRSKSDLIALELARKYEASLEAASKKSLEAIRHIESIAFGHENLPLYLSEAKKCLTLAIHMIVRAGITNQRKKTYVTKKDISARESLISQRKKLEDDNFQCYKCSRDDSDAGRESTAGQRPEHESHVE